MKTEKINYGYTTEMGEISGFGGGYENACRSMVIAALKWCEENPKAKLSYKEFKGITGLTSDESPDMKKMQEVMLKVTNNDCTGAMMQACMSHVMFIRKNGWDKYRSEMVKRK